MEYKYKITRETLIKILPFICACSYALGILLIILTVNSEYPIVGFLISGLCFVIGTVALVRHIKLKKETEENTNTPTVNNSPKHNNQNLHKISKGISPNDSNSIKQFLNHYYNHNTYTPANILRELIATTVSSFNKNNKSNINSEIVTDIFFKKYDKIIPKLTIEDINNKLFGFKTYIYMYCFMLIDDGYNEMKKQFASDIEVIVRGKEKEAINSEFYQIMDDVYIDKNLEYLQDSLDKVENIDDLPEEGLSALVIIDETISRFMKKYHLPDESFLKERENEERI